MSSMRERARSVAHRGRALWEHYVHRLERAAWVLKHEGLRVFLRKAGSRLSSPLLRVFASIRRRTAANQDRKLQRPYSYESWIRDSEPDAQDLEQERSRSKELSRRPKISIVVPVFHPPIAYLQEMLRSVQAQTYDNWELCLSNVGVGDEEISNCIHQYAAADERIKFVDLPENLGISGNSNRAIELASGEYVALLDHDDTLAPSALYEVAAVLEQADQVDLLYTDHDYLSADGTRRLRPLFKPDWSPEIMLSANYITHLTVIRSSLLEEVGNFQPDMEGAQDWDLFFRLIQRTQRIVHIPKVLYHWRESASSTANNMQAKPYASQSQIRAISNHLNFLGLPDASAFFEPSGRIRVKWSAGSGKVSIVILTRGSNRFLERCINSILTKTRYPSYEILIINNGEKRVSEFGYFQELSQRPNVKIIDYEGEFNYSRLNNLGVERSDGKFLLFLNNDTEVIVEDWLDEMCMWASRPEIGAVGGQLIDPNGRIQHAGVILGLGGFAGHLFAGNPVGTDGIFGSTEWYRNYSALTAACVMVRRDVLDKVGRFNEEFLLNGSDVEFGLRLRRAGLRLVYDPFVLLKHLESATHRGRVPSRDYGTSYLHYRTTLLQGDPYFSPNLSHWSTVPSLRRKDEKRPEEFAVEFVRKAGAFGLTDPKPDVTGYAGEASRTTSWFDATHAEIRASQGVHERFAGELPIRSVGWFIPGFANPYYGGVHTILRFADFLQSRKGVQNRFFLVGSVDERSIAGLIRSAFPGLGNAPVEAVSIDEAWERHDEIDATVSTLWLTAYYALRFNRTRRKFYFIQDYEPLFYPAGSIYGQVEATYRFGFYGLCNTPSLKSIYREQYGGIAESFLPGVDTNLFYPEAVRSAGPRDTYTMFFYGRPGHPRNAFELGAAALRILKRKLGDRLIIFSAGADWNPADFDLQGVVANLGLLTMEQTASLYRRCDAGLVMMFTKHPSYLPFEFMASGCLVVTNRNSATQWLLKDGENCLLTEPTPSCIAETLERGLVDEARRARIVRNAHTLVKTQYSNWDEQLEKLYEFMGAPKDGALASRGGEG